MFLKRVSRVILLTILTCSWLNATSKPAEYVQNLKHLQTLIQRKKSVKAVLPLDILFNEYVDDTMKLLKLLDQQNLVNQQDAKKADTVKQIAHYMAVLQKLLTIMGGNQQEPLKIYCQQQRSDALWGTLCGDRPAKRILKPDEPLKKSDMQTQHIKIHYVDANDDNTELNMGR